MKKPAQVRYLLPEEKWQRPGFLRLLVYMLCFSIYTNAVALWGVSRGVLYADLGVLVWFAGAVGGGFLAVGIHALRTGRMRRGGEYYRFEEKPGMFVADSVMVLLAVLLMLYAPFGMIDKELEKRESLPQSGHAENVAR